MNARYNTVGIVCVRVRFCAGYTQRREGACLGRGLLDTCNVSRSNKKLVQTNPTRLTPPFVERMRRSFINFFLGGRGGSEERPGFIFKNK